MYGLKIKSKRQEAGMTQYDLASKLGVKEQVVSRWETNRSEPNHNQIVDVARVLQVDPAELNPRLFSTPYRD